MMKKLLLLSVLLANSSIVLARGHGSNDFGWVVPALVGGAVVYGVTKYNEPEKPRNQQYPQMIQQPTTVIQTEQCSQWTEVQTLDGMISRTRTCTAR